MSDYDTSVDDEADFDGPIEILGEGPEIDAMRIIGPYPEAQYTDNPAADAVRKVIKKARDNRQRAPRMVAVPAESPPKDDPYSPVMTEVMIGAAEQAAAQGVNDPFPLLSQLMLRFGAGNDEPRYVRVDIAESYPAFRAEHSPEMAELQTRMEDLEDKLRSHVENPFAHALDDQDIEELERVDMLGAEVAEAERAKAVELWLPKWADGKVAAWREGGFVCASMVLPGADGEVRICTSMEPVKKAFDEMTRHAAEAGVPATTVIGVLPAMSCVLGAGTVLKEMAAAAPSVLEYANKMGRKPFVVRIEPKANPALCALLALGAAARAGHAGAREEWARLADAARKGAAPVGAALDEARKLLEGAKG